MPSGKGVTYVDKVVGRFCLLLIVGGIHRMYKQYLPSNVSSNRNQEEINRSSILQHFRC